MTGRNILHALTLGLALATATMAQAVSDRTTPAIESTWSDALRAIEAKSYILAQQLLTSIANQPENRYSARARELLGNVREFKGQTAQAVAEYRIYLDRFPNEPGAARVQARLTALLSGRAPLTPAAATAIRENSAAQAASPSQPPAKPGGGAQVGNWEMMTSGSVSLTYRHNEGTIEIKDLTPAPVDTVEEDIIADDILTAYFDLTSRMENRTARVEFALSGGANSYGGEDDRDPDTRVSELSFSYTNKPTGFGFSVGRVRLEPAGMGSRVDGVTIEAPVADGITLGFAYGLAVDSTYDELFANDDRTVMGVSAMFDKLVPGGELTLFAVEARENDITERQAVGAEYRQHFENGALIASLEYNTQLSEVSRARLSGHLVFPDDSRLSARAAYYRSPSLSLRNALIGQTEETLQELIDLVGESTVEQWALDRSAEITSFGMTYDRKLNDTWSVSANASVFDNGGMPASGGINAVPAQGSDFYGGLSLYGTSVIPGLQSLQTGLSMGQSDSSTVYVLNASARIPVGEKFTVRPSVRFGYRDYEEDADGTERFVLPVLSMRYDVRRDTALQLDVGSRLSTTETDDTKTTQKTLYLTAGITHSF